MDQHEPFDSALELRALPCLSDLICERWHPDLLEFLRETPFVDEVTLLNHGQRTLDLRGTSIRTVSYTHLLAKWDDFIADPGRYLNGMIEGEFEE